MHAVIQKLEQVTSKKVLPDIRSGFTVRVSQKIKEGKKERVQVFEGLVLAVKGGRGVRAAISVRKVSGGVGVEKTFLLHHPTIQNIEVVQQAKVRRAKLTYIRKEARARKMREDKEGFIKTRADVKAREQEKAEVEKKAVDEKAAKEAAEKVAKEKAEAEKKQEAQVKSKEVDKDAKVETASVESAKAENKDEPKKQETVKVEESK